MASPTEVKQKIRKLLNSGFDNDKELEHLFTRNEIDVNEREAVLFDHFIASFICLSQTVHLSFAQGLSPYLVDAATNGLHKCVQKLVDLGANVNAVSEVN